MKISEVYVRLIQASKKVIDDVPINLKEEVEAILKNNSKNEN